MKYVDSNAIGDAGEHFFAYAVAELLKWPCRLLDIDIGIDAQIEILDDRSESSGQFVAVQIKTTNDASVDAVIVSLKHIRYWRTVDSPVLLALVHLKARRVYVVHIDKHAPLSPNRIKSDAYEVIFDLKKDRLSKKHAPFFRQLAHASDKRQIRLVLSQVLRRCKKVIRQTDLQRGKIVEDSDHYLELMRGFRSIENKLHESKIWVERIRQYAGDCGYRRVHKQFLLARESLRDFLYAYEFHLYDGDEIKNFENELGTKSHYLELD